MSPSSGKTELDRFAGYPWDSEFFFPQIIKQKILSNGRKFAFLSLPNSDRFKGKIFLYNPMPAYSLLKKSPDVYRNHIAGP